jgi:hypothetical protein
VIRKFEEKAAEVIGLYLSPPNMRPCSVSMRRLLSNRWIASTVACPYRRGRAERHGFEYHRLTRHQLPAINGTALYESKLAGIRELSAHFRRPPDRLGPEHTRIFQTYLFRERKLDARIGGVDIAPDYRGELRGMFVRDGLLLSGIGPVRGLAAAVAATQLMSAVLYGVSALDAPAYGLASTLLIGAAALASYFPARRATVVDPVEALQAE